MTVRLFQQAKYRIMAVKPQEALYEDDHSRDDIESHLLYEGEDEEEEEDPLHELHKRISDQTYPLREEAWRVLRTALLSLNNPSSLHRSPLLSPLLLQLQSLRTLIPPTQGDESSTSCVITGALNYLERLSTQMQSLKNGIQDSTLQLSAGTSKAEVSPIQAHSFCNMDHAEVVKVESISNDKVHIMVQCKSREGLLSSLILALDTLGLDIDNMDFSCNDDLMVDAITVQVGEKIINKESVKEALWKIIHMKVHKTLT